MALNRYLPLMRKLPYAQSAVISRNKYKWPKLEKPFNPPPNDHLPFHVATLDDVEIPIEPFDKYYKRKNKQYNRDLIFGLLFLSLPITYMYVYQPIFWNAFEPELPPKEERIKTFWYDDEDDD